MRLCNSQKKSLNGIDCILLRHGFVYPGHGLVQLLSDGLGPTMYDGADFEELENQRHNIRRAAFIDAHRPGPFYVVDCDTASFIYLAIGEVLGYPLHLVDIPMHDFVRWELEDGTVLDYETMDGAVTDDGYYKRNWSIPDQFATIGGVLRSMSRKEAWAYYDTVVAVGWSWRNNYGRMIEYYERAITQDPTRAMSPNNLAWFYASVPKLGLRSGEKAVRYAEQAVAIFPDSDNLDTLACAYAQLGDFAKARDIEAKAIKVGYIPYGSSLAADMALFEQNRVCNDARYGKDPQPFRPNHPTPKAPGDKEIMRLH